MKLSTLRNVILAVATAAAMIGLGFTVSRDARAAERARCVEIVERFFGDAPVTVRGREVSIELDLIPLLAEPGGGRG